jgi:hypothetical protein
MPNPEFYFKAKHRNKQIICVKIPFIPKITQKLADRRVQSVKNRSPQRGLYWLDTNPFTAIDFWQLSIPPIGNF